MMLVRSAQLEALRQDAEARFVAEMVGHMRRFSPELHRTLGAEAHERIVRARIDEATELGFTRRGPIRAYLELVWLFGSGLRTDPQVPWVAEVLADPSLGDEMFRAGRLEALACRYLDLVHGPAGEHADAALRAVEEKASGWVFHRTSWREDVRAALEEVFPRKAEWIGPDGADRLLDLAEARALEVFGPDEVRGKGVLAVLMFSFGSGCLDDPLYPWIGATARSAKLPTARQRAEALERKAMMWVKAVNAHRVAATS